MTARISVICPAHNRSGAIVPTIRSVLEQQVDDLELIVVLDGCNDDTGPAVAQAADGDRRVRLLSTRRASGHPAEPRNLGLTEARGEFVAYIDHDDVWSTDHLGNLTVAIDGAGVHAAASGFRYVDAEGRVSAISVPDALDWHPEIQLLAPLFEPSRVMHRRGIVERVGGWRQGYGLEDWDLWLRLADSGMDFRAHTAPTAALLTDPATRRHHTAVPLRMPVALFDRPSDARRFCEALRDVDVMSALSAARVDDAERWRGRIAQSSRFRAPVRDHTVRPSPARDALDGAEYWRDPVLLQRGGGVEASFALWCASPQHAARICALVRVVHRAQTDLIIDLVRSLGGTPSWPGREQT